jgi:hypothetical protein
MIQVPQIPGITGAARTLFVKLYTQIMRANPGGNPNTVARLAIQQMTTNYGYRAVRTPNGSVTFKKVTPQMMQKMQQTQRRPPMGGGMNYSGLPRSAGY